MSSKTPKPPKQLYVTARAQGENEAPLGFLNAYEPGKAAFAKKRVTQEEWAIERMYINGAKIEDHGNGLFFVVGTKWVENPAYDSVADRASRNVYGRLSQTPPYNVPYRLAQPVREMMKHPPQVWDNNPLTGFKIEKSVSRYSTSNKLWRILDPRGVEFEISTGCLEQIIEDATILKGGVIDAKCVWMSNKTLIVVP